MARALRLPACQHSRDAEQSTQTEDSHTAREFSFDFRSEVKSETWDGGASALPSSSSWVVLTPTPSFHFWFGALFYPFKHFSSPQD